jgi:hypothetical protein
MAQFFLGTLTCPSTTGTQSISGFGFQPKVVLFFSTLQTAYGESADAAVTLGWAAATDGCAVGISSQHGVRPSNTDRAQSAQHCLYWRNPGNTIVLSAKLASFTSNGFNLTWDAVTAGVQVEFLAIGGDQVQAKHGDFAMPTTTGNLSVTGVGFQPEVVLFQSARATSGGSTAFVGTQSYLGWGAGVSSTNRWAATGFDLDNLNNPDHRRRQSQSQAILLPTNTGTVAWAANLVSLDSDGFTLSFSTVQTTAEYCQYLALRGLRVVLGRLNTPPSTGNQSVTGLGFQPQVLLLHTAWLALDVTQSHHRRSWGIARSTTDRRTFWFGSQDVGNNQNTISRRVHSDQKLLRGYIEGSSGSTLEAEADLYSLDSDGFTLNWTTVPSTSVPVFYLALGSQVSSSASDTATLGSAETLALGLTSTDGGSPLSSESSLVEAILSRSDTWTLSASEAFQVSFPTRLDTQSLLGSESSSRSDSNHFSRSESSQFLASEAFSLQAQSSTGENVTLPAPGEAWSISPLAQDSPQILTSEGRTLGLVLQDSGLLSPLETPQVLVSLGDTPTFLSSEGSGVLQDPGPNDHLVYGVEGITMIAPLAITDTGLVSTVETFQVGVERQGADGGTIALGETSGFAQDGWETALVLGEDQARVRPWEVAAALALMDLWATRLEQDWFVTHVEGDLSTKVVLTELEVEVG